MQVEDPAVAATPAATETVAPQATEKAADAGKQSTATQTAATTETAATEAAEWDKWYPEDWHDKWADGDEKRRKFLGRFKDPDGLLKKLENQEKLIRDGKAPEKPGADATPEDIAEYRTRLGLPETPDAYIDALTLSDGRTLGDDDKPVAQDFATAMHKIDAPQSVIDAGVGWYFDYLEKIQADRHDGDIEDKTLCTVELQKEFGSKKALERASRHIELALFDDAPDGLADKLFRGGRDANGKLLGNDPELIGWLAKVAQKVAPMEELMPANTTGAATASSELAAIQKLRDDSSPEYWNFETGMQARELELLQAKLNAEARSQKRAA